jgi:hypothetical protein
MPSDDPSEGPIDGNEAHVDFDKPAVLRKWPSLQNQRRTDGTGPYLVVDSTLNECIREFMAKPASQRHLYEIHTSPQPPLVRPILSEEIIAEFARLRLSLIRNHPAAPRSRLLFNAPLVTAFDAVQRNKSVAIARRLRLDG